LDNLTHPTKQERATARTLADDTTLAWGSGPDEYQELADRIAYALADARVEASVPIHLARPEHPRMKWCDGAFNLKSTTDHDTYTCVPCAIALEREDPILKKMNDLGGDTQHGITLVMTEGLLFLSEDGKTSSGNPIAEYLGGA